MNGYICLYQGKRFEVYAAGVFAAKAAAVEHFHPPKSKCHLITVHLAEKDGKTVTQVITN